MVTSLFIKAEYIARDIVRDIAGDITWDIALFFVGNVTNDTNTRNQ